MRLRLKLGEAGRKTDALHFCDALFASDCLINMASGQEKSAFHMEVALGVN